MNDSHCVACPAGSSFLFLVFERTFVSVLERTRADTQIIYAGTGTPSTTSANCYCLPGSYQNTSSSSAGGCVVCEPGSYCEGGLMVGVVQCPMYSTSAVGAKTRSDCVCQSGLYPLRSRGLCRLSDGMLQATMGIWRILARSACGCHWPRCATTAGARAPRGGRRSTI